MSARPHSFDFPPRNFKVQAGTQVSSPFPQVHSFIIIDRAQKMFVLNIVFIHIHSSEIIYVSMFVRQEFNN